MAAALAPVGLLFIDRERREVHPPLKPGLLPASHPHGDGRFDNHPDEVVRRTHPDFRATFNRAWLRMATEFGLFDEQREFLLDCTDYSPLRKDFGDEDDEPVTVEKVWGRVRLLAEWDMTGLIVEALHEPPPWPDIPEFTMVSLDQRMLLHTSWMGDNTVACIVIRPE
jgi:hypothetical protein